MNPGILKKDSWLVGIIMGICLPIIVFIILFLMDMLLNKYAGINLTSKFDYLYLLSFIGNLFPIRHYLVKLKFEISGLGVLLVTLACIIIYFYLFFEPK